MISIALAALVLSVAFAGWQAGRNYEVQRAAKRAAKEVIFNDSDHSGGIAVTGGAHPTNAPCKHEVSANLFGVFNTIECPVCDKCGSVIDARKDDHTIVYRSAANNSVVVGKTTRGGTRRVNEFGHPQ